jgi:hypothetical protein
VAFLDNIQKKGTLSPKKNKNSFSYVFQKNMV